MRSPASIARWGVHAATGALACLAAVSQADAGPFDAWKRSLRLTFSGYSQTEHLTNFPVLVALGTDVPGFQYSQFMSDNASGERCADLRFSDATGSQSLNYEIEAWAPTGTSLVWVQVPVLATNTDSIHAHWGMPGVPAPPATTNGSTWSGGFVGVWHLREDAAGTNNAGLYKDSSANRIHATDNVSASGKSGVVGPGQSFDGADDYATATDRPTLSFGNMTNDQPFSVSAWVMPAGAPALDIIAKAINEDFNTRVPEYVFSIGAGALLGFVCYDKQTTAYIKQTAVSALPTGVWTYVAATYGGKAQATNIALYANGVRLASTPAQLSYTAMHNGVAPLDLAASFRTTAARYGLGSLDEVRLASDAHSPAWIWASWTNQVPGSRFVVAGPVKGGSWGVQVLVR